MFAVFMSDQMDIFFDIIFSFPTVVFTFLLALSVAYWLLTVVGFTGVEMFDMDMGDSGSNGVLSAFSGLLFRLGLNGVPVTIVVSLVALLGWMLSFLFVYLIYPLIPFAWLEFVVGVPVLVGVFYVAAIITARLVRPLRALFVATNQEVQKQILGQTAVVRSGEVNRNFGEVFLEDGGAGLIVKVRSYKDEVFKRGDKVVLLEYVAGENIYRVVSEADFNN